MSRSPISRPAGNVLPANSSVYQIKAALRARSYRRIAVQTIGRLGEEVAWWSDGEHTVILHEYRQGHGCELYVQATTKNSIEATIASIPIRREVDTIPEARTTTAINEPDVDHPVRFQCGDLQVWARTQEHARSIVKEWTAAYAGGAVQS